MPTCPSEDAAATLEAARDAYARREWPRAHALYEAARGAATPTADDLCALSDAAWWLGLVDQSIGAAEAAYHRYTELGQPSQAARAAIDIAVQHFLRGDDAIGSGWVGRAGDRRADAPG